ncbi:MAG: VOC family protein [Gammaproteobacteria bacterium]
MTIPISNIDHVVLRTLDVAGLKQFYSNVFGCTVEREQGDIGLTQLRAGHALIDLVDVNKPLGEKGGAAPGREGRNLDHFCLRIEPFDEEAIRAHLASLSIEAPATARRNGAEGEGPSIYIEDPDGNTVELKGPPD